MTSLALASINRNDHVVPTQLAHDIRNSAATIALHLETLERLAGPRGSKAASAANTLIGKVVEMCSQAIAERSSGQSAAHRSGFDITRIVRQVEGLLSPLLPPESSFAVRAEPATMVLGNQTEIFRILFNLAHNAVMIARKKGSSIRIELSVERRETGIVVSVRDNGPGIPKTVIKRLFGGPAAEHSDLGAGLAIARELAERNGTTLSVQSGATGTEISLSLAPFVRVSAEGPVTRSLGRRATSP
jgi:two-component system C4-dicarboxylate transport sensor histidine kinase DctB